MASKTFKIGECAVGGIIRVNTDGETIEVRSLDWDTNDQLTKYIINARQQDAKYDLDNVLNELTTHYYAEEIIKWVEQHVTFKTEFTW